MGLELCQKCKGMHYKNSPCVARITKPELSRTPVAHNTEVQPPKAEGLGSIPSGGAKFDKAQWMRAAMPAYMRKYRAEVKAGIRVPKPRKVKT